MQTLLTSSSSINMKTRALGLLAWICILMTMAHCKGKKPGKVKGPEPIDWNDAFDSKMYDISSLDDLWNPIVFTDGKVVVPNNSVQYSAIFQYTPNVPDIDLVAEGWKVRKQLLYDFNGLLFDIRRQSPLKVHPMRKQIFDLWKKEYMQNLDMAFWHLVRGRFMKYTEKMQMWVEYLIKLENLFDTVSERWIDRYIYSLPRLRWFWEKRILRLRKRHKWFFHNVKTLYGDMDDMEAGVVQDGISKSGSKKKKKKRPAG